MNLTITVDDELVERAREMARRQGTSVQEVIREHLATFIGERPRNDVARELTELFRHTSGRSGGKKIRRSDAYEGRV
jgi:predicted transcriptional regulator